MSENQPTSATLEILERVINELARQIGAMRPDDPKWRALIDEVSDLTRITVWLRTETDRRVVQLVDELAHELAGLKLRDHMCVHLMRNFLSLAPAMTEH